MTKITYVALKLGELMSIEHPWNNTEKKGLITSRKTCPCVTFSTIIPTRTFAGIDPGLPWEARD